MLHLKHKCAHPFERITRALRQLRIRSEGECVDTTSQEEAKPYSIINERCSDPDDAATPQPQPATMEADRDNCCMETEQSDDDLPLATVALIQRLRTDQLKLSADVRLYRSLQRTTWARLKGTRRLIYLCQHNRLEKRKVVAKEQLVSVRDQRKKAEYRMRMG